MTLIDNPIVNHRHARWIALGSFILGHILIVTGAIIKDELISYLLMSSALILWSIPVMWSAKRWSEGK